MRGLRGVEVREMVRLAVGSGRLSRSEREALPVGAGGLRDRSKKGYSPITQGYLPAEAGYLAISVPYSSTNDTAFRGQRYGVSRGMKRRFVQNFSREFSGLPTAKHQRAVGKRQESRRQSLGEGLRVACGLKIVRKSNQKILVREMI